MGVPTPRTPTSTPDPLRRAFLGRATAQRLAVAAAADSMRAAFSAEDLAVALRARGARVGTATVYRALAAMEASGFVEAVGTRDGAAVYARCRAEGHHHHLVCETCGRVEEAPCDLGAAVERAAAGTGFVVTRHDFTLHGLCARCARDARGGRE